MCYDKRYHVHRRFLSQHLSLCNDKRLSRGEAWSDMQPLSLFEWICLIPIIGGSSYFILSLFAFLRFRTRTAAPSHAPFTQWPPVTLLKPVQGLEKNLGTNLRSACSQNYPEFQVVFAVQDPGDPVIPLLREI